MNPDIRFCDESHHSQAPPPLQGQTFHQYHRWKFHEWAVVPLLNKQGASSGIFSWEENDNHGLNNTGFPPGSNF